MDLYETGLLCEFSDYVSTDHITVPDALVDSWYGKQGSEHHKTDASL